MSDLYHTTPTKEITPFKTTLIRTTLYELIEAINNEINTENEELIPKIVLHLVNSGKIEFAGKHLKVVSDGQ